MSPMVGGSEAPRSPLRALGRGLAVLVVAGSGLFGFGVAAASADVCISLVCLPAPTPLPTVQVTALPTPQVTPLPTLSTALPSLITTTTTTSSSTGSLLAPPDLGGLLGTTTTTTSSSSSSTDPLGGLVDGNGSSPGQSCAVTLPGGVCVLPSNPTCPLGSTDPSCIVQTPVAGCTSNCTPGHGGGGGGNNITSGRGGPSSNGALPTGTFSAFGGGGLGAGSADPVGAQAIPLGLTVPQVPAVEQLSPVSGLQFGHALILWPLFGLLDVLALAAVCLVVRRFRVRTD
jgi:hypothetical protein